MNRPWELIPSPDPWFRRGETVVVAVSGGPDSMALLCALAAANDRECFGLRLHLAHLDHRLRGADSTADAGFVAAAARDAGFQATIESRDVGALAQSSGISIEAAGRRERYAFFHRVSLRVGAKVVALGHHADDNAETILHRIIRGTGFRGLAGIPESRPLVQGSDIRIVRPLLRATRDEILSYLAHRAIAYRKDASNHAVGPTRNRVRHELLPILESLNPRARESLLRLSQQAAWVDEHVDELVARSLESFVLERRDDALVLDVDALRRRSRLVQSEVVRRAMVSLLPGERDVSFDHVEHGLRVLNSETRANRVTLPRGIRLERLEHRMSLTRAHEPRDPTSEIEVRIAVGETTRIPEWNVEFDCQESDTTSEDLESVTRRRPSTGHGFRGSKHSASFRGAESASPSPLGGGGSRGDERNAKSEAVLERLSADAIAWPLVARHRRSGDRFRPLGAPGAKSLAEFLIDAKVARADRGRVIVLADQVGPVWLVGHRIAERLRITPNTRRVLRVSARLLEP